METYLRMLWLKYRYKLSYELVCRDVADSIFVDAVLSHPLGGRVPRATRHRWGALRGVLAGRIDGFHPVP